MQSVSNNFSHPTTTRFGFSRAFIALRPTIIILIIALTSQLKLNAQNMPDAQLLQMGYRFYNDKEYSKAAPIFQEYHEKTKNIAYFKLYFNCLTSLKEYKNAEKEIRKKIKKHKDPTFFVMWGYLHKLQGNFSKSEEKYRSAIELLPPIKQEVLNLGSAFKSRGEFNFAVETYEKGRIFLPSEFFHIELASVYYFVRNYEKMLDEYLQMLDKEPKTLPTIQSRLATAFYYDIDDVLKKNVKAKVLEYIQKYPNNTSYNKLIIWVFTHDKKFGKALIQSIALDKRTNNESQNIFNLAGLAASNKAYPEAEKAYNYLIKKGEKTQLLKLSILSKVRLNYSQFLDEYPNGAISIVSMEEKFSSALDKYGISLAIMIVPDYARFLAFYAKTPSKAILLLENSLKKPKLKQNQRAELKYVLAQCYVCSNDLWGATLQCAQIIDMARNNPLSNDAKLLKAKLGYYMGNFSWALAQMDILKAATSKLTANDAMELSLFIKKYTPTDSTDNALDIFARAEMQEFCHRQEIAITTLDSVVLQNPQHPIQEEVIYKKSELFIGLKQYKNAALALEDIIENHQWGSRIDDALFSLAELHSKKLDNKEKAEELYKDILLNHKGSIYLEKARKEFRRLRGD
jgi:tetratricopeptide (TPR) repeat protein